MRRYAPIDEIDDLGPPPPLPLIRFCGTKGCRRTARLGGRHCRVCHTAAVRRWRERHGKRLAVQRRDAATNRDDQGRARDSARAKLAMAIRRGKIKRGDCAICGDSVVIALMVDPRRPFDVTWVCRPHRPDALEQRRDEEEKRAAAAAHAAWQDERTRVLAAIDELPPEEQAQIRALAVRGPRGMELSPGAPLYVMNLVRLFKARTQAR